MAATTEPTDLLGNHLSKRDCARALHTTERTLSRWMERGAAPPWIQVGGRIMFSRESIATWLRESEVTQPTRRRGRVRR